MLFMELAVGQYTGRGPIGAIGQLCPLFKGMTKQNQFMERKKNPALKHSHFFPGAGMASVVVSFLMSTYYSVIIAYAIYYFFSAFRPEMPWLDCAHR